MLKQITPLGTTVKDRESPPSRHKIKGNRGQQQSHYYGEGQNEILELSPLARFMSGFQRNNCRHHIQGDMFTFFMEVWGDTYSTSLNGRLNMQHRTWSASWHIIANPQYPVSKKGFVELLEKFLKTTGVQSKENNKRFFSLTIGETVGIESLLSLDKEILDVLKHLLMQVVVLAALPNPAGNSGRQKIFRVAMNDYQVLREKCAFYFPWSGIRELKLTLEH